MEHCRYCRGGAVDLQAHEENCVMRHPEDIFISMFTIYENPLDIPGKFAVRRWIIQKGVADPIPDKKPWAVCDTLEEARSFIPLGSRRLPREMLDDPAIVESWV